MAHIACEEGGANTRGLYIDSWGLEPSLPELHWPGCAVGRELIGHNFGRIVAACYISRGSQIKARVNQNVSAFACVLVPAGVKQKVR